MRDKLIADTRGVRQMYKSLSEILNTTEGNIKDFIKNIDVEPTQYPNELKKYFNLEDEFYLSYITMHHFTSRLFYRYEENFKIDTLDNVLLNESLLTKFFNENQIEFKKKNNGINVYYKGKLQMFDNEDLVPNYRYYRGFNANNRLRLLKDTCVNGFLFNKLPNEYNYLKDIPEIFEFILSYIGDTEIKKKYIENSRGLRATVVVNIKDLIIDRSSSVHSESEKSNILLEYIIDYLKSDDSDFDSNPVLRLNDYKNVTKDEVLDIKIIR